MDSVDRDILDHLRRDGRISWKSLGQQIGLGPTATADRVRRLESAGVITGYRAVVNPAAEGRGLEARVAIRLVPRVDADAFVELLRREEGVVDAVHLTGEADYELTVHVSGTSALDDLLGRLKRSGRVASSITRVVLGRVIS